MQCTPTAAPAIAVLIGKVVKKVCAGSNIKSCFNTVVILLLPPAPCLLPEPSDNLGNQSEFGIISPISHVRASIYGEPPF